MNNYQKFLELHSNDLPFLLGNIWDVQSANMFAAAGYRAIGTSSHAIAAANGYADGEQIPFETILRVAKQVTETVSIPFTVDLEAGYSRNTDGIIQNIKNCTLRALLESTSKTASRRYNANLQTRQLLQKWLPPLPAIPGKKVYRYL